MLFQARNWHHRLLYCGPVWFSILGDYVTGEKGGHFTVCRVPWAIECHTIPVSKYLMVIESLCSIETIQGKLISCAALVCCNASLCLFPDCSPHHIVHILFLHGQSTCSMFVWNGLLWAHFNPFVLPMNGNDPFTEQNLQKKTINMLECFFIFILSLQSQCSNIYHTKWASIQPRVHPYTNEQDSTQLITIIHSRKCESSKT